jgi:hypothetical protein
MSRGKRLARRRSNMRHERTIRLSWFISHAVKINYGRYTRAEHRRMAIKLWKDFT